MTRVAGDLIPSLERYEDNLCDKAEAKRWRTEHERSRPSRVAVGSRILVRQGLGSDGGGEYTRDIRGTVVQMKGRRVLLEFSDGARLWARYSADINGRGSLDDRYDLGRPLWVTER